MSRFIKEASHHLPEKASEGTIVKVPVSMETDRFISTDELKDNHSIVIYYGFIRISDEWVFQESSMFA